MPFGLKNARATYQRLVNNLFKQQIEKSMEVYIGDMITKSQVADQHLEDMRQTFRSLKKYLASPHLIVNPLLGEELQLYLAVSETATSGALVKECGYRVQRPIYYLSRALTKPEKNYTLLEKLAYVLVTTARKLQPYFQAHTIVVVTDQPLRQFLKRPDVSDRLVLWSLELTQYDIKYKARTTIKVQALADFVAEFSTIPNPDRTVIPSPDLES
ncbi:hypothetical protein QYF36_011133 [Acer negundo]|nr:hypothetical protein QYF36_011133 [Acer negundo]